MFKGSYRLSKPSFWGIQPLVFRCVGLVTFFELPSRNLESHGSLEHLGGVDNRPFSNVNNMVSGKMFMVYNQIYSGGGFKYCFIYVQPYLGK